MLYWPYMDDDSIKNTLRTEWKLLIHSFLEDQNGLSEETIINLKTRIKEKKTTQSEVQKIKRSLSTEKKLLNQKIEAIKNQIESVTVTLQNLELVGSDSTELTDKLDDLVAEGEMTSQQIELIDSKLKRIRTLEIEAPQ
jgi:hypothetical protein